MRKKNKSNAVTSLCPCGETVKGKPAWIACDNCQQWWHGNCVNLTRELCSIFKTKNLSFLCPKCIVSKLPESKLPKTDTDCNQTNLCKSALNQNINEQDSEAQKGETVELLSPETHNYKNLVIIDGIKTPGKYQNSRNIQKEIRKHKGEIQMKYAYPLNRGGIVVHVETEQEVEILKADWPAEAFCNSTGISVHDNSQIPRCVFKNTSPVHSSEVIREEVRNITGLSVSVRRLKYRDTGRPMPIVVVTCESQENLQVLLKSKIQINKKVIKVVPYQSKRYTPTRCFNCQEFGHIAALCKKEERCEKCAENHKGKCVNSFRCVNCGGGHPASSLSCPAFTDIKERLLKRRN